MAKDTKSPNFWDAVSVVDAKLLQYLNSGTLADHAKDLVKLYLWAKQPGSQREFRSVVEQLEFLIATIAVGANAGKRKQLQSALETIKRAITE